MRLAAALRREVPPQHGVIGSRAARRHHHYHPCAFASLVRAISDAKSLAAGRRAHHLVLASDSCDNRLLCNSLILMYGSCTDPTAACSVFGRLCDPNVHSWNFVVSACVQNGQDLEALHLFSQMDVQGFPPNQFVYATVLRACATWQTLSTGQHIHVRIVHDGLDSDVGIGTSLINMYSKCSRLKDAHGAFACIAEQNTLSFTALIQAYARSGQFMDAFQLFSRMHHEGALPSRITLVFALSACPCLAVGKQLQVYVTGNDCDQEPDVKATLLNMYAKYGALKEAKWLFSHSNRDDVLSWNAMIAGCIQHGRCQDMFCLFKQMILEGVLPNNLIFARVISACASQETVDEGKRIHACILGSGFECDIVVKNSLISMYGKCGHLDDAQGLFDQIFDRDKYTWTAMITALAQHGKYRMALHLFLKMLQEQVDPDRVTFASILSVCADDATLDEGKLLHAYVVVSGHELDIAVGNALVSMYSKCGTLEDAKSTFDKMSSHDMVSWNTLIAAYAQHGQGEAILQLFEQMHYEGVSPNVLSFVSFLTSCSHTGMYNEACHYFTCMDEYYGIKPVLDHYNCIIDLLGRVGRLDDAEVLMKRMPVKATAVPWTTLLSACKTRADLERGVSAAKELLQLDPNNAGPYVTLANMFMTIGMENEAFNALSDMHKQGSQGYSGCYVEEECAIQASQNDVVHAVAYG